MGGGEARMVLLATCQLVEEAGLPLGDTPKSLRELNACYDRVPVANRVQFIAGLGPGEAHLRRSSRTRS